MSSADSATRPARNVVRVGGRRGAGLMACGIIYRKLARRGSK